MIVGAVGKHKKKSPPSARLGQVRRWVWRWTCRAGLAAAALIVVLVLLFAVLPVPATPYMLAERWRLGDVKYDWVQMSAIAPVMARSAVAAEDANYCLHWGFDIDALRQALDGGAVRGGSTISQQVVKNVFLWQGRSWPRKAAEALLTPFVELIWSKSRILEVYMNVAEFDEGVFGVGAAAQSYFGVKAADLSAVQAARLAAILPDPKGRSAAKPSSFVRKRSASILDGAATIRADGRAACFSG